MRGMPGARRDGWAFALLVTLVLAATVGAALAAAKLKTQSETVDVGAGEHGSATAECEKRTKAISGGFEADYGDPGGPFFYPDQSSRAAGRRWTSGALNVEAMGGELTSLAYCRDERVKSRTTTESVAEGETVTVNAKCKRGTKVVSGGFDAEERDPSAILNSPSFWVTISRKLGARRWEVRASNQGFVAGDLTAQVNCREDKGLRTKRMSEEVGEPGVSTEVFDLEARCKREQRSVSGGFAGPDFSDGATRPFTSMKVGRRGWHFGGLGAGEMTAYAYCERKQRKEASEGR